MWTFLLSVPLPEESKGIPALFFNGQCWKRCSKISRRFFQIFSFAIFLSSHRGDFGWFFFITEMKTFGQDISAGRFLFTGCSISSKKCMFSFRTLETFSSTWWCFSDSCFTECQFIRNWIFLSGYPFFPVYHIPLCILICLSYKVHVFNLQVTVLSFC